MRVGNVGVDLDRPVAEPVLRDFEDAVQAACAEKEGVDVLVTRNEADFQGIGIQVLSPVALLSRLDQNG